MTSIGPHEYHYLHHPLFSSGEAMLYYTLEHLVHTGAITFEHGRVHLGHGEDRVVDRLFFTRAVDAGALSPPEAFAMELLPEGKPFTLADMRQCIDRHVPQHHDFKAGPMQEHLIARGLLSSAYFTTAEGRRAYHHVSRSVHQLEHDEDKLLTDMAELDRRLAELGSNAILVHQGYLEKLREMHHLEPKLKTMLVMQHFLESGGYRDLKRMG